MSRPVLSICIPSFNRETLALELLHELDAPGFLPFAFEVLLVDNASTASAYDTVRTFAPRHYPFRYLRLPRTVSAFSNVMGALRRASGELCMYLADDDRLAPDALAETIAVMQAQPAILATYCTWDLIDLADGRVVRAATPLEEAVFSEATAAEPLTGLVRRAGLPEIGVYRTATLPGSLLPTAIYYWSFLLILRQLRVGAIRFSSRSFYRYVSHRPDEPAGRWTLARTLPFETWQSLDRSLDLWSRFMPPEWLAQRPETSPFLAEKRTFQEFAFAAALDGNRYLEAFDVALGLKVDADYQLPMKAPVIDTLCARAAIEALHRILGTLPELEGIAIQGFDAAFTAELESTLAGLDPEHLVRPVAAADLPPAALPRRLVLTLLDLQRPRFLLQGCVPGLVYSMEGLLRVFNAQALPPPRFA